MTKIPTKPDDPGDVLWTFGQIITTELEKETPWEEICVLLQNHAQELIEYSRCRVWRREWGPIQEEFLQETVHDFLIEVFPTFKKYIDYATMNWAAMLQRRLTRFFCRHHLNLKQKLNREPKTSHLSAGLSDQALTPFEHVLEQEYQERDRVVMEFVYAWVSTQSQELQTIFHMRHGSEPATYETIGEAMRCTGENVRIRLKRMLNNLEKDMPREFGEWNE